VARPWRRRVWRSGGTLWRWVGHVGALHWVYGIGSGLSMATLLGFVSGLPWEAYSGAGAVTCFATAFWLGRRERRSVTGTESEPSSVEPAESLAPIPSYAENDALDVDDREVIAVTPKRITDLYKNHTDVEANRLFELYLNKWITISGTVRDVSDLTQLGAPGGIRLLFLDPDEVEPSHVVCNFTDRKWFAQVDVLTIGERVTVHGQIEGTTATGSLKLRRCELR
jgi:hypothetical protein